MFFLFVSNVRQWFSAPCQTSHCLSAPHIPFQMLHFDFICFICVLSFSEETFIIDVHLCRVASRAAVLFNVFSKYIYHGVCQILGSWFYRFYRPLRVTTFLNFWQLLFLGRFLRYVCNWARASNILTLILNLLKNTFFRALNPKPIHHKAVA